MELQAEDAAPEAADAEAGGKLDTSSLPTLFLEGPFGAPSLHHTRYETLVMAATGVG